LGKPTSNGNPNLTVVRRVVREMGGTIVRQVVGGRHLRVTVRTDKGAEFSVGVNRGKVDAYKQAGWIRQRYNKANASIRRKR
jgi:hypothetical protein